ncbi:hypothetical protein SNE40_013491 [Patella caerulea]|uniref:Uncharacterized protein n=1 Tax=Patella caerulea TaxID=87958 RepID=A0AAN8JCF3_PATCE
MTTLKKLAKPHPDVSSDDKWCLVCATVLTSDGVELLGDGTEELQKKFHQVLKAPVPKKPPSSIICKKCDRNIRRIAGQKGEAAEREMEYMQKTYRKTVSDYNLKVERKSQKLKKVAEAFMGSKMKAADSSPAKPVTVAASRWRLMAKAKSSSVESKIPLPSANGASSPGGSPSGAATPTVGGDAHTPDGAATHDAKEDSASSSDATAAEKKEVRFSTEGDQPVAEAKTGDKSPLVKHDSLEKVDQDTCAEDRQSSTSQEAEQTKDSKSETKMPFSFFKKKESIDEKPLKEENELKGETHENAEAAVKEVTEVVSTDAETAIISTVKSPAKDVGDQDGGTENKEGDHVQQSNGEVKAELATTCEDGHRKNGDETETKDETKLIKKEKTPLIKTESNVKDTGPGMLCCTIM